MALCDVAVTLRPAASYAWIDASLWALTSGRQQRIPRWPERVDDVESERAGDALAPAIRVDAAPADVQVVVRHRRNELT